MYFRFIYLLDIIIIILSIVTRMSSINQSIADVLEMIV